MLQFFKLKIQEIICIAVLMNGLMLQDVLAIDEEQKKISFEQLATEEFFQEYEGGSAKAVNLFRPFQLNFRPQKGEKYVLLEFLTAQGQADSTLEINPLSGNLAELKRKKKLTQTLIKTDFEWGQNSDLSLGMNVQYLVGKKWQNEQAGGASLLLDDSAEGLYDPQIFGRYRFIRPLVTQGEGWGVADLLLFLSPGLIPAQEVEPRESNSQNSQTTNETANPARGGHEIGLGFESGFVRDENEVKVGGHWFQTTLLKKDLVVEAGGVEEIEIDPMSRLKLSLQNLYAFSERIHFLLKLEYERQSATKITRPAIQVNQAAVKEKRQAISFWELQLGPRFILAINEKMFFDLRYGLQKQNPYTVNRFGSPYETFEETTEHRLHLAIGSQF